MQAHKLHSVTLIYLALTCLGCAGKSKTIEDLPPLPEAISSLPIGIVVEPSRSIAEPQLVEGFVQGLSSSPHPIYRWEHPLTIQSLDQDVQILEYGIFVWGDDQWYDATAELAPYSAEAFAQSFDCQDATLKAGQSYESNLFSNLSNVLRDKPIFYRWYFIGETNKGRCRGEVTLMEQPPQN